jgi:hypothetical protein
LQNPALLQQFRTLIGRTPDFKPFECVGDVDECRAAVVMAGERHDRATDTILRELDRELALYRDQITSQIPRLLRSMGSHFTPDDYASAAVVG